MGFLHPTCFLSFLFLLLDLALRKLNEKKLFRFYLDLKFAYLKAWNEKIVVFIEKLQEKLRRSMN